MDVISKTSTSPQMIPSVAARQTAIKQIHEDRYASRRPWLAKIPSVRLALIFITYRTADSEGDILTFRTWTTGITSKSAMRNWRNRRPDLREEDAEYTVASEAHARVRDLAQGERVEPDDPLLASYAP